MPRRKPSEGEGATGGESAAVLSDACHQVTQRLAQLQEALQLQGQEAMRRQEETERNFQEAMRRQKEREGRLEETTSRQGRETERRLQEALRLQEQRATTALHDVVKQMETKLQEKDEVIRALQRRLEETQRRVAIMEGRAEGLEVSAKEGTFKRLEETEQRLAVVEERIEGWKRSAEKGELRRLEGRMQQVEASLQRAMRTFIPRVDGLLRQLEGLPSPMAASSFPYPTNSPSKTSPKEVSGRQDTSPPETPCVTPSTSSTSIYSDRSTSFFSSDSARRSTEAGRLEETFAGPGGAAKSEELVRQRVELRIWNVKERVMASLDTPSRRGQELNLAVVNGNLEDVHCLLDAGAEVNYVTVFGYTPLMRAFMNCEREDMVTLLLQRGADPNAVNIFGNSAMHEAAVNDCSGRCVELLVAAGADVNARSGSGATPLHWAVEKNNEAAVRALLAAGARRDLKLWEGYYKHKTPLEIAISRDIHEILSL